MTTPQRYSREWFMAAADQAQAKVDEWPAQMRRNAVIAEARMPTANEPRMAAQRNPMRPGDYCDAWRDNQKRCQRGAQCGCAARGKR